MAAASGRGGVRGGALGWGRVEGERPGAAAAALLLLPLLLLPPQLLAGEQPAVARAAGPPVCAPARVHGLPPVQGAGLALRAVDPDEVLPGQSLLAGPVLSADEAHGPRSVGFLTRYASGPS